MRGYKCLGIYALKKTILKLGNGMINVVILNFSVPAEKGTQKGKYENREMQKQRNRELQSTEIEKKYKRNIEIQRKQKIQKFKYQKMQRRNIKKIYEQ